MDGHGSKRRLHGGAKAHDCTKLVFWKATPLNAADCGDETQKDAEAETKSRGDERIRHGKEEPGKGDADPS